MPIAFRCTRCRATLHVPSRWGGTSVSCPKCTTRVMVPASDSRAAATPFERSSIERSLAALDQPPGGVFAAEGFDLPEESGEAAVVTAAHPGHLILPRWTIYALLTVVLAAVAVSFVAGARWARFEAKVAAP